MHTNVPVAAATAALLSVGLLVHAQQAQPSKPASPPAAASSGAGNVTVHIEGCVVPKRAGTAASSTAGSASGSAATAGEYVLTDTKVIALAPGTQIPAGRDLALTQVDAARVHQLAGKRAEVTGRLQNGAATPQLQVTSIVETVGDCSKAAAHS